ncbi:hypothetical protein WJX84_002462 [Apatococcus fuscideae]|uniref:Sacsin/Nov domain-containing protein n=1 Tax=Apatococcus fuscideae TaxID=2026836 RepID=A0AAW1THS6_9CHLO
MVSPPILLETLDDRATFMQWCVQQGFEITESFLLQLVSADIPEAGSMLLAAWGRLQDAARLAVQCLAKRPMTGHDLKVLEDLAAWSTCLLPAFWEQNLPVSYVPPEECMLEYVKMRCAESQAGDPSKRLISLVKSLPADQQSYSLLWQDSQGVDAVTHAAGCLKPSVLVELQQFQTLLLEECAHPFASTASCASAASEEGRRMYYETHADQIEAVIKLLVAWVQQQQPSHSALSACLDQPGNTNAPALVTLLDNYCSGLFGSVSCLLHAGSSALDACKQLPWHRLAAVADSDVLHMLLCHAVDEAPSAAELVEQRLYSEGTFSDMMARVCRTGASSRALHHLAINGAQDWMSKEKQFIESRVAQRMQKASSNLATGPLRSQPGPSTRSTNQGPVLTAVCQTLGASFEEILACWGQITLELADPGSLEAVTSKALKVLCHFGGHNAAVARAPHERLLAAMQPVYQTHPLPALLVVGSSLAAQQQAESKDIVESLYAVLEGFLYPIHKLGRDVRLNLHNAAAALQNAAATSETSPLELASQSDAYCRHFIRFVRSKHSPATNAATTEERLRRADDALALKAQLANITGGIYSKRAHFLLELIQNADDLDYHDCHLRQEVPSLCIWLSSHGMSAGYNEDGFDDKDIWKLCSIGRSEKKYSEKATGMLGQGFKSIFSVSAKPHIISKGFR